MGVVGSSKGEVGRELDGRGISLGELRDACLLEKDPLAMVVAICNGLTSFDLDDHIITPAPPLHNPSHANSSSCHRNEPGPLRSSLLLVYSRNAMNQSVSVAWYAL